VKISAKCQVWLVSRAGFVEHLSLTSLAQQSTI